MILLIKFPKKNKPLTTSERVREAFENRKRGSAYLTSRYSNTKKEEKAFSDNTALWKQLRELVVNNNKLDAKNDKDEIEWISRRINELVELLGINVKDLRLKNPIKTNKKDKDYDDESGVDQFFEKES